MKIITAPMAGTVLRVLVEAEAKVSKGQEVIVLESMKMEIPIESTCDSKVASVQVSVGDFVNEGDILVNLD